MSYADGFVLAVKKDKVEEYRAMAELGKTVWREHGALDYREFIADDVKPGEVTSFPQAVKLEADEVVVFSFITYRSRAHRDEVNAKVMADPRMKGDPARMPYDMQRMIFGGFNALVE